MADSLAEALAELQANPPKIRKKARAQYGAYADLPTVMAALRPALKALGLLWQTWPDVALADPKTFVLRWRLTHLASGDTVTGEYPLHATNPQQIGSEITYARRYALVTVTGVTPEGDDDDGQAASRPRTPARVTGAEHERLRYGTVERTPDDRPAERGPDPHDKWQDVAPDDGGFDIGQPEDRPGSIDARQLKAIGIAFSKAGIDDRAVRLGMVSDMIGRQVLTSKQLSRVEADHVLKRLKEREQS